MECTGRIQNIAKDWNSGRFLITFEVNENTVVNEIESLKFCDKLSIIAKKWRKKRSVDANALLWHCIGEIASAMSPPAHKWDIYLLMLRRYGQFTYICVKENAVEKTKAQWRECEIVGDIEINGQKAVQLLCYFGSHTYNTKEFSVLLDGVISEMVQMGIPAPTSKEMRRSLELWEKQHEKAKKCIH